MPKIVDHEQYRKELLNQCFSLFAETGYGALTMRQIAKELGVSTGTLYHYFPSKESLFEQFVEEVTRQDILRITAALEPLPTLEERITAVFAYLEAQEDYFMRQTLIWLDFYQQQGQEKIEQSGILKRVLSQVWTAIADVLRIQDQDLVIFVSSFVEGLILEKIYDRDSVSIARQGVLLAKMLTAYQAQYPTSSHLR